MANDLAYMDLFSGIGGFSLGFKQAGFTFDKHYASEIDKYARSIYARQFPGAIQLGDITKIGDDLGEIDIITGGFPCQSFSIAGKRGGFEDTRGTLFFEIARLVEIYQPSYMVLENVKGLLSHDNGDTIRIILDTLRRLDYHVQMLLLNTKDFGVPQNRERVFFICSAAGERRPEIFHLRERKTEIVKGTRLAAIVSKDGKIKRDDTYASTLTGGGNSGGNHSDMDILIGTFRTHKDGKGFRRVQSGICPTIPARAREDGSGQSVVAVDTKNIFGKPKIFNNISPTLTANHYKEQIKVAIPCLSPDRVEKRQNGRRFKENGDPMFTLTSQDRHGVLIKSATKCGYETAQEGDAINFSMPNSKTRRGRVGKQVAQTLDTACNQGVMLHRVRTQEGKLLRKAYESGEIKHGFNEHRKLDVKKENVSGTLTSFADDNIILQDFNIRRLTPIECERLQAFPDDWTKYGKDDETISDSQRYKCLGNAVTVKVVEEIAKTIKDIL